MDLLLDTEEFVEELSRRYADQIRSQLACFTPRQWKAWKELKKPGTTVALNKAWERWKSDMKQLGLLLDAPPEVARDIAYAGLGTPCYALELTVLQDRTTEAIEKYERLEEARVEAGGRFTRRGGLIPLSEAAKLLGVPRNRLYVWYKKKGMPAVKKRGKKRRLLVNMTALDRWINRMCLAGEIRLGPCRPAVEDIQQAIEDAHGDLHGAIDLLRSRGFRMNLSNLYQITLREKIPYTRKHPPTVDPTEHEIVAAMKGADDRVSAAAGSLGIPPTRLRRLIDEMGLRDRFMIRPARVPKGGRPLTREDVVEALELKGFSAAAAAEALGIKENYLNQLINRSGLRDWVDTEKGKLLVQAERAERARIEEAIHRGIAEGLTRREIASSLGLMDFHFYAKLRKYELQDLIKPIPKEAPARRKPGVRFDPDADRIPFWLAALNKVVAEHSKAWVASSLGVSRSAITLWTQGKAPSYESTEKIVELAGGEMPPWEHVLHSLAQSHRNQREAAAEIGLTQGSFSKLRRGEQVPGPLLLQEIMEYGGLAYMVPREVEAQGNPDVSIREAERRGDWQQALMARIRAGELEPGTLHGSPRFRVMLVPCGSKLLPHDAPKPAQVFLKRVMGRGFWASGWSGPTPSGYVVLIDRSGEAFSEAGPLEPYDWRTSRLVPLFELMDPLARHNQLPFDAEYATSPPAAVTPGLPRDMFVTALRYTAQQTPRLTWGVLPDVGTFLMHVMNYVDPETDRRAWPEDGYELVLTEADQAAFFDAIRWTRDRGISVQLGDGPRGGAVIYFALQMHGVLQTMLAMIPAQEGYNLSDQGEYTYGTEEGSWNWSVGQDDAGWWAIGFGDTGAQDPPAEYADELGPYETEAEAIAAGYEQARVWCDANDCHPESPLRGLASEIMTTLGYEWI
jgi:excisionase family DNA binding protein